MPSNSPDRQFSQVEHETITPAFAEIEGKQYHVSYRVERDYSVGLNQQQPKIPGWKRAWNALWGYGTLVGLLILLLTFLGVPAIPMLLLAIRRIRFSNKHLQQIVSSVDDGLAALPSEQQAVFKAELAKTQDTDTKKMVKRMREDT